MAHKSTFVPRKALVDFNGLLSSNIPIKTARREITNKYGLAKDALEKYFNALTAKHQRVNGNN